jgi:C4-dicarboxylate-binding protein DctP
MPVSIAGMSYKLNMWRVCLWAVALVALMPNAPAAAEPSLRIRFSHVVANDTPKGLAVQRFQQLVHTRSGGDVAVVIYPRAQLYGDVDEVQALQLGAVEMIAPSLSKFGRMGFPEFELFDLPFLFASTADVAKVTKGAVGRQLLRQLERIQLLGLGYLDNGFKHMSANKALIAPSDFVGLRMRVQSSRVIAAQMKALGAQPVALSFGETQRALTAGVVDGTENPVSNFWTQGMNTVQSHFSLTQHGYLGYAVVTNQSFWRGLSAAHRQLIAGALADALAYGNAIAQQENDKALQALKQAGTTVIDPVSDVQRQVLRHAVQPAYDDLEQRIGTAWLEQVNKVLRQY